MAEFFDVICFGALNVDIIYMVDKIPQADEEGYILDFSISCGGSAANTAVGLANFGKKTSFVGAVGKDEYGKILIEDLKEKLETFVEVIGDRSGKAMVFVDTNGQRAILVDPGANDYIYSFPHIEGKILHLTSFICRNSDSSFRTQIKAAEKFNKRGYVSLDPGNIYAERKDILSLINKCSIFMPNSLEIEKIFKMEYRKAVEKASEIVEIVVVKLGDKGCYVVKGNKKLKIPAINVNVVDTTGAGDAFNAGFLYALLEGYDLEACCYAGNFSAAKCIEKVGARNYPEKYEIDEFLCSL